MEKQKKKIEWWGYAVPILALIFLSSQVLLTFRVLGKYGPIVYLTVPMLVSAIAILMFLIGLIFSLIKRPFIQNNRLIWLGALLLFPSLFFLRLNQQGNILNSYPSSHYQYVSRVNYRVPFDTTVSVFWGGDKAETNYHVIAPDQRWAYDIIICKNNTSHSGDSSKLENYFIYGMPVLSPANGEVVKIFDTLSDLKIGKELPLSQMSYAHGNFVMLKTDSNEYLVMCHLKPKSISVKVGDQVTQSQKIGEVGNSGNTSEPHLHIHLQDSKRLDISEGIPLYFHNYMVDGKLVKMGMPQGGIKDTTFIGQNITHKKI